MKKNLLILLFLLIFFVQIVFASSGHMKLLAVVNSNGTEGGFADLYLDIEEGSGRVFIDTFPLTKVDTQMSTRFAKEIACSFLEFDCNKLDFFYTIRSDSIIVGGPSAGAAIAVLTTAMLDGLVIDESISITGTINSGGIIGPVGGIEAKVSAAEGVLSKVLIPKTSFKNVSLTNNISNSTDNFINTSLIDNLSIEVVEVSSLADALFHFTGKHFKDSEENLIIDPVYEEIMRDISDSLCSKTDSLILDVESSDMENNSLFVSANELINKSVLAINRSAFYPAASYCFSANIKLSKILVQNFSNNEIIAELNSLKSEISDFELWLDNQPIETISDLQTKIIVKERVVDSLDSLSDAFMQISLNDSNAHYTFAYASERFYSARIWSGFFGSGSKKLFIDSNSLRNSCITKISEAEERFQYVNLIFPFPVNSSRKDLNHAREYLDSSDFELCLFKASKAKASLDVALSALHVSEGSFDSLIEEKLSAAKSQIIKESSKGRFPIMGYSYYLYAEDLKSSDKTSSLIYSELSLELSNLWPYFRSSDSLDLFEEIVDNSSFKFFSFGFLFGFLLLLGPFLFYFISFKRVKVDNSKVKNMGVSKRVKIK